VSKAARRSPASIQGHWPHGLRNTASDNSGKRTNSEGGPSGTDHGAPIGSPGKSNRRSLRQRDSLRVPAVEGLRCGQCPNRWQRSFAPAARRYQALAAVRKDIVNHLKEDPACIATTMVDYYGLPQEGEGAWPGRKRAAGLRTGEKAPSVENALLQDVMTEMDPRLSPQRFVPFVVMHEFEGLLFSDCAASAAVSGSRAWNPPSRQFAIDFPRPRISMTLRSLRHPSASRILPRYEKPLLGSLAALEIGLGRIRRECPHFDAWLAQLESRIRT